MPPTPLLCSFLISWPSYILILQSRTLSLLRVFKSPPPPHPSGACLIVTSSRKPLSPACPSGICPCYAFPSSWPPYVSHPSTQHLLCGLRFPLDYKLLEGKGMSILLTFYSQFQIGTRQRMIFDKYLWNSEGSE